ncbi:Ankyrin repeat domain-containing protein 29 [Taenia solium]|eukprot:TsM_000678400 transcript=TsM_000678400 gene=TsM_000678400
MAASIDSIARIREKEEFAELLLKNEGTKLLFDNDKDGNSLTHLAALHGNVPLLRFLLEKDTIEIEARNVLNQTPLFFAVLSGSIETVRIFLEAGASFDVADTNGETVVHISAKINNLEITEFISTVGTNLNCVNAKGETALHLAVQNGFHDIVRVLLGRGTNSNVIDKDQLSPLHLAAKSGNLELVRGLLFYGADSASPNGLGITADVTAYALGHNDVGKLITSITPVSYLLLQPTF